MHTSSPAAVGGHQLRIQDVDPRPRVAAPDEVPEAWQAAEQTSFTEAAVRPSTQATGIDGSQNLLHPEYYVEAAPCHSESVYTGISDPQSLQDSVASRLDQEHLNDAAYGLLNEQRHRGSGPHSHGDLHQRDATRLPLRPPRACPLAGRGGHERVVDGGA